MLADTAQNTETKLETVLRSFAKRRWRRPFTPGDLELLIGAPGSGAEVIVAGIAAGYFERRAAGDFQLTTKGATRCDLLRAGRVRGDETPSSPAGSQLFQKQVNARPVFESAEDSDGSSRSGDDGRTRGSAASPMRESSRPSSEGSRHSTLSEGRSQAALSATTESDRDTLSATTESDPVTLSATTESGEPTENRRVFIELIEFTESDHRGLSVVTESVCAADRIKTPEGSRRYPYQEVPDLNLDLELIDPNPSVSRARARSKLDTTLNREQTRHDRIARLRRETRSLIKGTNLHQAHPDHARMVSFAAALQEICATYSGFHGQRIRGFVKPKHYDSTHHFYRLYVKAAKLAESVGADYLAFIKAQFYWFDLKMNKPPKLWEISSDYSLDRWSQYKEGLEAGRILRSTNVIKRQKNIPISQSQRWSRCDSLLRTLMRNYEVSALDALRVFAPRNEIVQFDEDWLQQQPEYAQLKAEGAI